MSESICAIISPDDTWYPDCLACTSPFLGSSITFYGEDTDVARRISRVGTVKWTFKLPMYTSGRRLAHDGVMRTGIRYAANYIYMLVRGKPLTKTYTDIRDF